MNRKLLLFCLASFGSLFLNAQTPQQVQGFCGTGAPPQQWDSWFNNKIEEYTKNMAGGKSTMVVHTIPVIVHVIYFNEAIGTYPNIDSNQIKSQIAALNRDFSATGVNVGNVPSVFSGLVSNTGIKFCMARKDRQDQPLVPHGIDRVGASANSWLSPATPTLDLQNYFNTVIIPATIWDPTKYLNIWVSDKPLNYPMNGFATYPPSSGLTGVFGGNIGTATNDGVWIWAKAFGTVSNAVAPYNEGRTCTHEVGHWLGLRHIWGDGNCLSDYCNDTPTAKQAHYACITPTMLPVGVDACGVGTSPNGEMPMNFMDRTEDACMYMFTHDQNIRMQTALSQSPLRYQLGTHDKCALPIAPSTSAVASFTTLSAHCLNQPFTPFNTSSGFPYPTYVWSSSPAAGFSPNNTVANPAVTLSNPGFYTLTLVATNSLSSSTATFVVSAQNTCAAVPFCLDSIRMIKNTDTLTVYKAPNSAVSGCGPGSSTGYLVGTNCYKDKEFAQYFPPTSYSNVPNPQVNSVIVLFDTAGTKGPNAGTQVVCKIYGGSVGFGPASVQGSKSDSLGKIVNTPKINMVGYIGKPNVLLQVNTKMYPFRYDFASPIIISSPTSGFFAGIQVPLSTQDSINIVTNTKINSAVDSSAWYLSANLSWRTFKSTRGHKIQMAMIPIITCGPVGINEETLTRFNSGIHIMPNPGSGLFNLVFTFQKEESLTVNVYNAIGQRISSGELKNVMNNVVNLDLTNEPEGIYFTEISNGSEKVVKKIVLSH